MEQTRGGNQSLAPRSTKQGGFTLVEMAIVLAIIGLILGAVMIGKDVQRNAEYTKVKQKFLDQWAVAYNAYYQRTGVPVGDSQTAPRLMVDGANFAGQNDANGKATGVLSGGNMTGVATPGSICHGTAPTGAATAQGTVAGVSFDLRDLMLRAGVRMPPGRAEGSEDRYVYLDTNGNPQEIQVCFQWNPPGTPEGSGNVMVISGLTPDLARYLDQEIDGKPDAREGLFRQYNVANDTNNAPGVEWGANNTFAAGTTGSATGTGATKDEDQVITVTAVYKMNQ